MTAPARERRSGRVRNHEVAATVVAAIRSARDDLAVQDKAMLAEIRGLRSEVKDLAEAVGNLADATRALLSARSQPADGPASPARPRAARPGKDT